MTGTDHHIAGLGNLIEWTNRSDQYVSNSSNYYNTLTCMEKETLQQKVTPNIGPQLHSEACQAMKVI